MNIRDISYIIHFGPPVSIEEFKQATGKYDQKCDLKYDLKYDQIHKISMVTCCSKFLQFYSVIKTHPIFKFRCTFKIV